MFIFRFQHLTMCCLAIIGLIADVAVTAAFLMSILLLPVATSLLLMIMLFYLSPSFSSKPCLGVEYSYYCLSVVVFFICKTYVLMSSSNMNTAHICS